MSYSVTTNYDSRMPSWPGNGTPFRLIACHDTEGGTGRAGALGTIQFLINTPERGASYHEIWWYHESTDEFGVIRIVQPFRASGSIGPQQPPAGAYEPTTWVKNALGAGWWDPNQGCYAVSIAGRVADVNRYAANPKFLAHAHRRMMELWKEFGITKRAEHFQFQPSNRSDWGRNLMTALGGLVTKDSWQPPMEITTMEWMKNIKGIPPVRMLVKAGASFRLSPDLTAASSPWVSDAASWRTVFGEVAGVDFGAGPKWYVIVSDSGGLKVFHSQDVDQQRVLLDPATVDTDPSDEIAAAVAPLQETIETQAAKIADLMNDVAMADAMAREAVQRAEAAEDAAGSAVALRTALTNFMT